MLWSAVDERGIGCGVSVMRIDADITEVENKVERGENIVYTI